MPVSRHVQRAADSACAVAQHVGVDHRRRDVAMAEQFLHRADVVAPLEQVRREGMAKAVTGHALVDSRCPCRIRDGPLDDGLVQVMPAFASLLVAPSPRRGKDPLPQPLVWCLANSYALFGAMEARWRAAATQAMRCHR